jgi:hypothetical protein
MCSHLARLPVRSWTERPSWADSTAPSYSGSRGYKPRHVDRLSWLTLLLVFVGAKWEHSTSSLGPTATTVHQSHCHSTLQMATEGVRHTLWSMQQQVDGLRNILQQRSASDLACFTCSEGGLKRNSKPCDAASRGLRTARECLCCQRAPFVLRYMPPK